MRDPGGVELSSLKVFISYSRKVEALAQVLLAGLDVGGIDA